MRDWMVVVEPADADVLRDVPVRRSDEYLQGASDCLRPGFTVINLCRSYDYLTLGYYVSLVADARGHRVFPGVEMVEDLSSPFTYFRALQEAGIDTIDYKVIPGRRLVLPRLIVAADDAQGRPEGCPLADAEEDGPEINPRYVNVRQPYTEVTAVFGRTSEKRFRRVSATIYRVYPYPLLTIRLYEVEGEWKVGQLFPTSIRKLTDEHLALLRDELHEARFVREDRPRVQRRPERLACLWDCADTFAPSDEATLDKFARVASRRHVLVERIGRSDLTRLAEYDALFIRSFTAINNHTFTFAQTAESLNIPVIDDPDSIVRCSNKVYLHELFRRSGVPTPRTRTISRRTEDPAAEIGFPLIVKLPDGSFSQAVKKVNDPSQFEAVTGEMFKRSPLLIVQEFTPTEFDWRITVLEGRVLFSCRYFMAGRHWQIQQSYKSGYTRYGKVEAVPRDEAPREILALALEAAALIGNGLYGVDIKETPTGAVVIEINDNPSIETGYEDQADKDKIYEDLVDAFLRRMAASARVEVR